MGNTKSCQKINYFFLFHKIFLKIFFKPIPIEHPLTFPLLLLLLLLLLLYKYGQTKIGNFTNNNLVDFINLFQISLYLFYYYFIISNI